MQPAGGPPGGAKLSPLQRQREYLAIARGFLDQGLKHDEAQNYTKALELYGRGLEVLKEALRQPYGPDHQAAMEPIATTMQRYLANFADRMGTLQVLVRQPPIPKPKSANAGMFAKLLCGGKVAKPAPAEDPVTTSPAQCDAQLAQLQYAFQQPPVPATAPKPQSKGKRAHSATAAKAPSTLRGPATGATAKHAAKRAPLGGRPTHSPPPEPPESLPLVKRLEKAGVDPKLLDQVLSSIVPREQVRVSWEDVAGLAEAKQALYESVLLPLQRPDLFTGLRAPARGILLFGPPGTGKTYIAKACAHTGQATFFSVSASTLTSKYVGEGEKLVKAIFMAAQELQPAIIFVDEVDSLLTSRSDHENEASRRLKTEFMVQMEGLSSAGDARNVLVLGATNRPQELDDAILRRFPKRLCIPLPDPPARELLLTKLLGSEGRLSPADIKAIVKSTDGYSNADLANVCREATMMPIRELGAAAVSVPLEAVRPVMKADVLAALKLVRPSASETQLKALRSWSAKYGSSGAT
eukprot:GGOE01018066.1.p1 GENE.GGOE01018066.1~~GGOE01018066.1.p1  ORF type:complete len:524 (+),score=129.72 GGOE01018066.1:73-1644(+)